MILADKIIDLRKKNGWSQEELAEKLGVSRQAVSKWESAQAIPDLGRVLAMADLFSVTTDYLLRDENEAPTIDVNDVLYQLSQQTTCTRRFIRRQKIVYHTFAPLSRGVGQVFDFFRGAMSVLATGKRVAGGPGGACCW